MRATRTAKASVRAEPPPPTNRGRIEIPLRARDRPVDPPEEFQRNLATELHVRYLASIGAAPTPANLAVVKKHLPPMTMTTAWKSRGWDADYLYVSIDDPPRRKVDAADPTINLDRLPAALLEGGSAGGDGEEDGATAEQEEQLQLTAPSGCMSFSDGQRAFLYPYKLLTDPNARFTHRKEQELPTAPLVKHRRNVAGLALPTVDKQLNQLATTGVRTNLMQAARTRPSAQEATTEAIRLVDDMIARPAAHPAARSPGRERSATNSALPSPNRSQ